MNRRRQFVTMGGGGWQDVAVPAVFGAALDWLPFSVEKNGSAFRPKSWDVSSLRPAEGKAYYVSTTGNNSNNGLSWATAYRSIWQAGSQGDAVTIYVEAGFYGYAHAWRGLGTGNVRSIIGVGGRVINSNDLTLSTWTAVDNHYTKAGITETIGSVLDAANLNSYGDYTKYTLKTSEAEVDAEAGTYYKDGANILYVHCLADRAPDSNLRVMRSIGLFEIQRDNASYYFENIDFEGGVSGGTRYIWLRNASATGGLKVYSKNCTFKYNYGNYDLFDVDGASEVVLQGCEIAVSTVVDGINYTPLNNIATKAAEIDCIVRDCGTDGNDQASTSHNGSVLTRMSGQYYRTTGQAVADVGPAAATAWMLGCEMHDCTDGYYLGNAGSVACLDGCIIRDVSGYDLNIEAGATVYTRNLTSGGHNNVAGTLTPY